QQGGNFHVGSAQTNGDNTLNFVLLDGTWNNSAAVFRRLKCVCMGLTKVYAAILLWPWHLSCHIFLDYETLVGVCEWIQSNRSSLDKAKEVWGEDLPCISLATGASAMHKLRPQPSWDRTCTAAAAVSLLEELQLLPEFSSLGFDKQAKAIEDALVVLLDSLTVRRLRMGRSITRRERHNRDIC
ncbi:hypothetical protein U1Q18_001537, partial [Sarracenia purpurea var. burkii]